MNACDHGHLVEGEVRLLPTGGDGNAILCRSHYDSEMVFRKERIADGVSYPLPKWETLKVYDPE